jgi:hypothetical protein
VISDDPLRLGELREVVAGCVPELADRPLASADDVVVQLFAEGLGLRLVARAGDSILLWLVPSTGEPQGVGATWRVNQAVLDVPAGRYVIDVFSIPERRCTSREVSAASPLVIGLPDRREPLLARIERVAGAVRSSVSNRENAG